MSDPDTYRHRTKSVRASARESLRRLRSERLARRSQDAPGPGSTGIERNEAPSRPAADSQPILTVSRAAQMAVELAAAEPVGSSLGADPDAAPAGIIGSNGNADTQRSITASEPPDSSHLPETCRAVQTAGEDISPSDGDAPEVETQATAEALSDGIDDVQVPTPVPSACRDAPAGDGDPPRSDLADLPGAGPGLVWMLSQCGVFSMADLASADGDRLTEELGLVGQLLNLDSWIDHARRTLDLADTPTLTERVS